MKRQRIATLTVLVVLIGSSMMLQGCGLFGGGADPADNAAADANEASTLTADGVLTTTTTQTSLAPGFFMGLPIPMITVTRTTTATQQPQEEPVVEEPYESDEHTTAGNLEEDGSLDNKADADADAINEQIESTGKSTSF